MRIRFNRERAVTLLVAALVTIIIFVVTIGSIYVGRSAVRKVRTIEERRNRQLTNIVDGAELPAYNTWLISPPPDATVSHFNGETFFELPDSTASNLFATVHSWRIEAAPSLAGPWTFTGNEFISDERFLRDIMLTIAAADSRSEEPRWFYRGVRP